MTMKYLTDNLQLLLADLHINKMFKEDHLKNTPKRIEQTIKSIRKNIKRHLPAISNPNITDLLKGTLKMLKKANSHIDQLSLISITFLLLLSDTSGVNEKYTQLVSGISSDLYDTV